MNQVATRPRKPVLVGELEPRGSSLRCGLHPEPENSAGGRLCRRIMRLEPAEYLRSFERVSLCAGPRWRSPEAKLSAYEVLRSAARCAMAPPMLILLGARVAEAFSLDFDPYWMDTARRWGFEFKAVLLPHPNRRNPVWNDPTEYHRARRCLERAGVLEPAGSGEDGVVEDGRVVAGRRYRVVPDGRVWRVEVADGERRRWLRSDHDRPKFWRTRAAVLAFIEEIARVGARGGGIDR